MRRRWSLVAAALVLVAGVWAAVVSLLVGDARAELELGRAAAGHGADALLTGDVAAAAHDLAESEEAFARGAGRLRNPLVRMAGLLPVIRPNLRTATALADAGALVAGAGGELAGAVAALPGGMDALAPSGGALPVPALQALAPAVTDARERVVEAKALVAAQPSVGLLSEVADARAQLDGELDRAEDALATAEPLVRVLPAFLGVDGPRRYFFGAAQPAEQRGATGFVGAYAILTLDKGRFSFSDFQPIQDLPVAPPGTVEPPNPDFLARYGDLGGTGFWQNLNVSPDFPTTGTAVERLWEHTFGERLDGTISADPFALAALLRLAGPTEVPGVGVVDADTVVSFVANQAYSVLTDPEERKRLLGDVAAAALTGFLNAGLSGGAGPVPTLQALGGAVGEGHVLVHAADPQVQEAFEAAGLAGRLLDPPGDFLAAVVNGATGSKIDYYLDRELAYTVALEPDGRARATATLALRNDAPTSGQPNYVIGPNSDRVVAGENELYVSAYGASSATFERIVVDGRPAQGQLETELGHPVVETFEELPSGAGRTLEYALATSEAWEPEGGGGRYRLTVQQQSTIRPTRLRVEVRVPEGMTVVESGPGWSIDDGMARFAGELRGTFTAELAFGPPAGQVSLGERLRRWVGEPAVTIGG